MASKSLVICVLFALSCKKGDVAPAVGDGGADAAAAAAKASDVVPATTNLLVTTAAQVTVSSRVDNPRDFPEHLVDGKPETAWNGKTGDLAAWIEVELDPRVHVTSLAITSGFDKGDLFEKNLRVEKLEIARDGVRVKEVTLDPSVRKLQRIPIDGPGGTYRMTVRSTVPGTNPSWKEIVISDVEVLGEAPEAARLSAPRVPVVKVAPGSAPPPKRAENVGDVKLEGRRGASVVAICEAWKQEVLAVIRSWPGVHEHAECGPIAVPPVEGTRPSSWKSIAAIQRAYFDGVADMTDRDLVIELDDGWIGGPRYQTRNDIGDSPEPLASRIRFVPGSPTRLVTATATVMRHWPVDLPDGGSASPLGGVVEHEGKACVIEGEALRCDAVFTRYARGTSSEGELEALASTRTVVFPVLDASGKIVPLTDR